MTGSATDRQKMDPDVRKAWGRAINSVVTIGLAVAAFQMMADKVNHELSVGTTTSTSLTTVWGTGAIALCVALPRAFAGLFPGGRKRLPGWPIVILFAAVPAIGFCVLMHVPASTCVLALLTFVGPVLQDIIDG